MKKYILRFIFLVLIENATQASMKDSKDLNCQINNQSQLNKYDRVLLAAIAAYYQENRLVKKVEALINEPTFNVSFDKEKKEETEDSLESISQSQLNEDDDLALVAAIVVCYQENPFADRAKASINGRTYNVSFDKKNKEETEDSSESISQEKSEPKQTDPMELILTQSMNSDLKPSDNKDETEDNSESISQAKYEPKQTDPVKSILIQSMNLDLKPADNKEKTEDNSEPTSQAKPEPKQTNPMKSIFTPSLKSAFRRVERQEEAKDSKQNLKKLLQ